MIFYPSKTNNRLNRRPFAPEHITGTAMVNPHYRVRLAPGTRYIIDSGAFQERDMHARLQPWRALDRQLRLETQIEFGGGPAHAEALITYDMLDGVDEALTDAGRIKRRGTDDTASQAVYETIRSARYYKTQEGRVRGAIAYACQGVSTEQYIACARALLPLMRPGRDWFAFGGFCITGLQPARILPVFVATLEALTPLLADRGITRAHLLGVCFPDAIGVVQRLERACGVTFSTDSSAPERAGVFGSVYHAGRQRQRYTRDQKYIDYHPRDLAHQNIRDYAAWLETPA